MSFSVAERLGSNLSASGLCVIICMNEPNRYVSSDDLGQSFTEGLILSIGQTSITNCLKESVYKATLSFIAEEAI